MKILSAGATDPGKKRGNNEDAYLVNDELGLYAVADGVGGHEGGEVASHIAVETFAAALPDLLGEGDRTPAQGFSPDADPELAALRSAVALANRRVRREREQNPDLSDMGTTLTALFVKNARAFLVHVGDSRAYCLRSGELRQITSDHSLVAEQRKAGVLTPEQARRSPYRHVITRALGIKDDVLADAAAPTVQQGDTFLLCTDGLTEMVGDQEIAKILAKYAPRDAVRKLVDEANRNGGVDNITAVAIRISEI